MKQFIFALTLVLALAVTVACASSGGDVYNSKCAKCHGVDGTKASSASGGVMLKGQSTADIEAKLKGYLDDSYGAKKKRIMKKLAGKLSAEELTAVADHIGSL